MTHALEILTHYTRKGLTGNLLRAAVRRHQRILAVDSDVVAELAKVPAAEPARRRVTVRSELEARWERERTLPHPQPAPTRQETGER